MIFLFTSLFIQIKTDEYIRYKSDYKKFDKVVKSYNTFYVFPFNPNVDKRYKKLYI